METARGPGRRDTRLDHDTANIPWTPRCTTPPIPRTLMTLAPGQTWSLSSTANDYDRACRLHPGATSASKCRDRSTTWTAGSETEAWRLSTLPAAEPRLSLSEPLDERHPIAAGVVRLLSGFRSYLQQVGPALEILGQAPSPPASHQEGHYALTRYCLTRLSSVF